MSDDFEKNDAKEPTQAQVFELLGRLVYMCNVIELRLRWMHKHSGGIWTGKTPEELKTKLKKALEEQQKDDRRMLGLVGQEMIDAIYTPRSDKDFVEAQKNDLAVMKIDYKIETEEGLRRATEIFKKFIDARNYLIHYFSRDYSLATLESCQNAYSDLKEKLIVIQEADSFFGTSYNTMIEAMRDAFLEVANLVKEKTLEN